VKLGSLLAATLMLAAFQPSPAVPLEPVGAIVEALRTHRIVAIGEWEHVSRVDQQLRLHLLGDSRLVDAIDDIVVEFGGAVHQPLMDRYMNLESLTVDVPRQAVLRAMPALDNPVYDEFFRAVREINRMRPTGRRLRVLLGEAPDYQKRDQYVSGLIKREVLDKNRKALVFYGSEHVTRRHPIFRDDVPEETTFVTWLERAAARVFSVWPIPCTELAKLQPNIASWQRPSLTMINGTVLGSVDYFFYSPIPFWNQAPKQRQMAEMVDAVLCVDR
jgi:hypothetical protein